MPMRALLCVICLCLGAFHSKAADFKLFAVLLENSPVDLSDGSRWVMDKEEVFPVVMYKEMGKKMVLQLDDATFWIDSSRVRLLKTAEIGPGLVKYRASRENYRKVKKARATPVPAP